MQRAQADMPHPYGMRDAWGLGWVLFDWAGRRVLGRDGDTLGQTASVRVVPDSDVVVALLGKSDGAMALHRDLLAELPAASCDL